MLKVCTRCKELKSTEHYHVDSKRKDKLCLYCKPCAKLIKDIWLSNNKEKHAASMAKWYAKSKHKRHRTWTKHHYKKYYGITYEEYVDIFNKQEGKCAICDVTMDLLGKVYNEKACMDHCHTTGKIREVLCNRCNWGLGKFMDSPDLLRKAASYLEKHN